MNLEVLKSSVHFSKWRDSPGAMSLSFDVKPQGREHLEIGQKYVFAASDYAWLVGKDRQLLEATVSVSPNKDVLENMQSSFTDEDGPICGWASFYDERKGSIDYTPASLQFSLIVEPDQFAAMLDVFQGSAGATTLNVGLDKLEFGWEPDGSHLIWKAEKNDKCPITSFSYHVERFWTTEGAIRQAREKQSHAELADSPDPEHRKLAASVAREEVPDATTALLKQFRSILVAILVVVALAVFRLGRQ